MLQTRAPRALFILSVILCLVLPACAQSEATEPEVDTAAVQQKIVAYMTALYPNLQGVEVESLEKDASLPFLKGTVVFNNRGRQQKSQVYVTGDGKYLVLGQVWDMDMDPAEARWEQRKQGSEERLAKVDITDRPFKGNPEAPVLVVEFSDYQCPFCARAYTTLEQELLTKYGDRIKLVFKHLPLESLHPWAKKAAVGAACAYIQQPELFWEIHNRLFENQKSISVENLRDRLGEFADEVEGLDKESLLACFDEQRTVSVVEADQNEAQALGLSSTPTFLVNGALIAGAVPLEEMTAYIDLALKEAEGK